jgi:hypothetical protein
MDDQNLCWRGMPGSGKRNELHKHLQIVASQRGIPFHVSQKIFQITPSSSGQDEDGEGTSSAVDKNNIPYEFSYIHFGFDIARMSMQDKILLRPILQKIGSGAQVLTGNQQCAHRILVFYHAHLLSTESCYLLHGLLEEASGISIWLTSELPLPHRLADYFLEIPVSSKEGKDLSLLKLGNPTPPSWNDVFKKVFYKWSGQGSPTIQETTDVRDMIYEILMRNLRWVECIHILMDVFLEMDIPLKKKQTLFLALADQEATAAGQTIPSYRIPLLWESLFLRLREAVSKEKLDDRSSLRIGSVETGGRKVSSRKSGMVKRGTDPGGHEHVSETGSGSVTV